MGTRLLCLILSTVKKLAFDYIQKVAIKRCWPDEKHDNHWTCGALGSFVSELVTIPTGVFLFFFFFFMTDGVGNLNWAACTDLKQGYQEVDGVGSRSKNDEEVMKGKKIGRRRKKEEGLIHED